jgi:hypothetical protein
MRILLVALTFIAAVTAQAPVFQRGDAVRVRPSTSRSEGSTQLLLKVVAIPGDRLHVLESRLYVNDTPLTGFSAEFLARLAARFREEIVPAGHYYVMGEQRVNTDTTQYWGLHSAGRLEQTQ